MPRFCQYSEDTQILPAKIKKSLHPLPAVMFSEQSLIGYDPPCLICFGQLVCPVEHYLVEHMIQFLTQWARDLQRVVPCFATSPSGLSPTASAHVHPQLVDLSQIQPFSLFLHDPKTNPHFCMSLNVYTIKSALLEVPAVTIKGNTFSVNIT